MRKIDRLPLAAAIDTKKVFVLYFQLVFANQWIIIENICCILFQIWHIFWG